MQLIYTWVSVYQEITSRIRSYRNDQSGLLEILKQAGADGFDDKDGEGNTIPLAEIDPFTFFCYLNKYGDVRRKLVLKTLFDRKKQHYKAAIDIAKMILLNYRPYSDTQAAPHCKILTYSIFNEGNMLDQQIGDRILTSLEQLGFQ
jgi:hypothetical protein